VKKKGGGKVGEETSKYLEVEKRERD